MSGPKPIIDLDIKYNIIFFRAVRTATKWMEDHPEASFYSTRNSETIYVGPEPKSQHYNAINSPQYFMLQHYPSQDKCDFRDAVTSSVNNAYLRMKIKYPNMLGAAFINNIIRRAIKDGHRRGKFIQHSLGNVG